MLIEVLGIISSIAVLISFIFKDVTKIRIANMIGCVLWVIYGSFIISFSVILQNAVIMIIHIIYLIRSKYDKNKNRENKSDSK